MNTFKELFEFLQKYDKSEIICWLQESWQGKDKQESLLRLFAGLGLISKIGNYNVCKGNFNIKTITKHSSFRDIFYNHNNELIKLKDNGDASDLTCISKYNDKHLLVTTSKNLKKMNVGKLDIDKILTNFGKYIENGYIMTICVCIRDNDIFESMKRGIKDTNVDLKTFLEKEDTIIIDWNDLNQAYHQFNMFFKTKSFDSIINSNKYTLCLKMHQHLGVIKTIKMCQSGQKKILWGHIQRSGKSYIIGGCIVQDSLDKNFCNYMVITTAPNETITQQRKVFDCVQLQDFNIIILDGKNKKPNLSNKNIIICSKQFLQTKINDKSKTNSIIWLKKMLFEMRFIDESHNGGTTELAQKTLDFYGKDSFTVQITATYSKPINDYNIPKNNWILWDLEDIKLCKNICDQKNIDRLIEKHGSEIEKIIKNYSQHNIIQEYSKYPELWVLTHEIDSETVKDIVDRTQDNDYGWSLDGCFLLNQDSSEIIDKFQNEEENLKLWYMIFGKKDKYGIPDKEYPDKLVFLKRIEKICKNPSVNSRFNIHDEPMIIMAFLPQHNIDKICKATTTLLLKNKIVSDYEIVSINSKTTNDPKQTIEDGRMRAKNSNKKGVLVLSGRQCSLGVSIDNCDIVLLLNNNNSFDMIYQMMFRCMTEGKGKKCGFVVDLNIHRVIETCIVNYASFIKPELHPKKAIKYILDEKLIILNGDHFLPSFGKNDSMISSYIYDLYSSNTERVLIHVLNRLRFKQVFLTRQEQKIFNIMFSGKTVSSKNKQKDKPLEIKKGIQKTKIGQEEGEEGEEKVNFMEILKHIIPLVCILTIHNEETLFIEMFKYIQDNKDIFEILIDQTISWWGKSIDSEILEKFVKVYIKYMKEDKETEQIIRTVKELLIKNVGKPKKLSKLIDKYLIPQELEKKKNAEVSTPFELRKDMLDIIPSKFWKGKKFQNKKTGKIIRKYPKIFEPCAGKGGFVIDIIDRLDQGMKKYIPDHDERYKVIVEECLYFADINPTNIYICKLLVDPYNEYKLNYYLGNTLELDICDEWGVEGFDAVIGNPPYNDDSGNRGKGHTLWTKFIEISLEKWINKGGYLLYVNPSLWRQADHPLQTIMKQYQIEYLEIHDEADGVKIFNCNTRYDWYLINKVPYSKNTKIKTQTGEFVFKDLSKMNFIPNYNYDLMDKLVNGVEKINILHSESSYEVRKKWMSHTNNEEYKYPCVYSINRKNDIKFKWSSLNSKGMFGKSKVIFGSGATGFIIDENGEYGLTQWATGIEDKIENLNQIKNVISSTQFMDEVIKATSVSKAEINRKILKYFKKDFWKEFI